MSSPQPMERETIDNLHSQITRVIKIRASLREEITLLKAYKESDEKKRRLNERLKKLTFLQVAQQSIRNTTRDCPNSRAS